MSNIYLSFRDWPYQHYINQPVKCAWSECDFFAYALGSTVVILSNDNGQYTPIYMWSPFESDISCIAWANGSLSASVNRPIIAIASNNGRLIFFNVATASIVTSLNFKNEKILSLKFSTTRPNFLYIGFESGVLIYAKLSLDKSQIYESIQSYPCKHPIHFISFDLLFESVIAVASESGNFSIIRGDKAVVDDFSLGEKINSFEFYPGNNNFILISAASRTLLFHTAGMTVINFLAQPNIFNSYITEDRVVVVERDRISLYRSSQKSEWKQISEVAVSSLRIESTVFMNEKIMMMTSPLELYQIEIIRDKLFVTKHCSLLNTRPVDWSFYKGSIAFSTANGFLHITVPTSEAYQHNTTSTKKKKDQITLEGEGESNKSASPNNSSNDLNTNNYKIGNSCNFLYSYEISDHGMRIKWISDSLLIMWSQSRRRILTVDLVNKTVKDLNAFKFLIDKYTVISQVIVSPDKTHLCIVINNQTAILFSCPDLNIVSFIALKEVSIGTFYIDSSMLFFVSNSSVLYLYDMQGKLTSTRAFSFDSNPIFTDLTTITCSESGTLYIGDVTGSVYKFAKKYYTIKRIFQNNPESAVITDGNDNQNTINTNNDDDSPLFDIASIFNFGNKTTSGPGSPSNSNGANTVKKSSVNPFAIASVASCGKLLLIIDRSGHAYSFTEESTPGTQKLISLPYLIENYKYASDSTILVKFGKQKRIASFNLKGKYSKRRPPAWYRNRMLNEDLKSSPLKTAEDFLSIGITLPNLLCLYNRKSAYKSSTILINSLLNTKQMNDPLYELALVMGIFPICKKILKKTNPKASNFLWNMTTLAFFDLDKPGESMNDSIQLLKEAGNYNRCYELLMVTKDSKKLLNMIIERNDYKHAFFYIRNQSIDSNSLENCEEEINNLSKLLLESRNPIAPIIIMAQLGMFNEICVYIAGLPFDNTLKNALVKFIHHQFIENEE